jgi:hypothetical protein
MSSKVSPGVYARVGDKKGTLNLSAAFKRMDDDPSFVYVPMYRVAGPLKEVKVHLKKEYPDSYSDALEECYSKDNLEREDIRDIFDQEIEDAKSDRADTRKAKDDFKKTNLMIYVKLVKMYEEQKKSQPPKEKKEKSAPLSLKEKVKALAGEKKVLDITNMKKKGNDSKKMLYKEGSGKRRLTQDPKDSLYNVVYGPENKSSQTGVRNFLENYGSFKEAQINKLVDAVKQGNVLSIGRSKSPTRSLVSPRRNRKQQEQEQEQDQDVEELLE